MNQLIGVSIKTVEQVLLADGWHRILPESFQIGELVFVTSQARLVGPDLGGQGVQWREADDGLVTCPMSAVLGIRSRLPAGA